MQRRACLRREGGSFRPAGYGFCCSDPLAHTVRVWSGRVILGAWRYCSPSACSIPLLQELQELQEPILEVLKCPPWRIVAIDRTERHNQPNTICLATSLSIYYLHDHDAIFKEASRAGGVLVSSSRNVGASRDASSEDEERKGKPFDKAQVLVVVEV